MRRMMVSIENKYTWQDLGFAPVELARLFDAARGGFDEHKCSYHKRYYGRHRVIRSQMFDKHVQRRPFDFIFIPILRRLYFTEQWSCNIGTGATTSLRRWCFSIVISRSSCRTRQCIIRVDMF